MIKKFVLLAFFILLFFLFKASPASAALIINEFSSASTIEWVELLNTDENNPVSLAGYEIKNNSGTTIKTLSGTVPRRGFLTFEFPNGSLNDNRDCLVLWNGSAGIYSVSYGEEGSCSTGTNSISAAPTSSQTGALIDGVWQIDTTPSRGWCNDATGGCPPIATIVSSMASFGVTTNLGEQNDYSRTSGLYFEKTGYGRINFLDEMNFTDRDALSWMQQLNTKLDLNTKARISLDADLIKNLVSTRAQLTMYGLTLANPKIQVNGADDTEGIVSGISYSGGTLTFTAAHFTVFTAVENSRSSSSSSSSSSGSSNSSGSSSSPSCSDQKPDHAPSLFQIKTTKNSATLYFTPVNNAISYYFIAYGFGNGDERFGVSFPYGYYNGVVSYTVNHLKPNTKYYFKVRAGHGCAPGDWSNVLGVKTEGWQPVTSIKKIENTNVANEEPKPTQEVIKKTLSPTVTTPESVKKESAEPIKKLTSSPKKSFFQRILDFFLGKR